jgi:hypothetical protein
VARGTQVLLTGSGFFLRSDVGTPSAMLSELGEYVRQMAHCMTGWTDTQVRAGAFIAETVTVSA